MAEAIIVAVPKKGDGKNRKKSGNKHAFNTRRRERKASRNNARITGARKAQAGRCGSSFCSRSTGCEPWK